jgi:S1-C subfamily serine protease
MTDTWKIQSDALADTIEGAGKSIVRVDARRHLGATGVVWSAAGVIVTTSHAVRREQEIEVGLPDGSTVAAQLIGRDLPTDLAVLRIEPDKGLTPATWSGTDGLRVGNGVVALARPGRTVRAALGIVGALGGEWRSAGGASIERYLEPDVRLGPGFSGGPLLTTDGRWLGLTTAGLLRHAAVTLPAATLQRVVPEVIAHGHVRRGYLGIGAYPVPLPEGTTAPNDAERGLMVVSLQPKSPADQAGVLLGDVLLAVDGATTARVSDLIGQLNLERIGKAATLTLLRAGQVQDRSVTIGSR